MGVALTDDYSVIDNALALCLTQVGAYTQRRGIDGAWTWFNDPRVILVNGSPVVGGITSNGTTFVSRDNTTTGLTERALLHNILLGDDHCNPGIIRASATGKIVTAYNKHNDPSMFSRISTNVDDVTSFAPEIDLAAQLGVNGASNYAYANFVELTGREQQALHVLPRHHGADLDLALFDLDERWGDMGGGYSAVVGWPTVLEVPSQRREPDRLRL